MTHRVKASWIEELNFSMNQDGIDFEVDNVVAWDGSRRALSPKAMMLSALIGCTGMDVSSLLKKMRAEPAKFELEVVAEMTDEHPKHYKKAHVIYRFYGQELKEDKINKAVDLSVNRYCGVYEMFRQFAEVSHEIQFLEAE